MQRDERRAGALETLTKTLGELLAIGAGDLPQNAREQLDAAIASGARVEFLVQMAPLHLRAFVTRPDSKPVLLFEVETGPIPDAASLN